EASIKGEKDRDLQVILAGLWLLGGDTTPARKAAARASADNAAEWGADWMAQLGDWYYVSGDASTALDLLNIAVQRRPGNRDYLTSRAWVLIEKQRYSDALQDLDAVYDTNSRPDRMMARAVTLWRGRQLDAALQDFNIAVGGQPEWDNPRWVKGIYSPLVVQSVQEMHAEHERRLKAQAAKPNQ